MAGTVPAAKQSTTLFLALLLCAFVPPLAAHTRVAPNSHPGLNASETSLHPGFAAAKPQNATGFLGRLRLNSIGCRCTGKERDAETGLDYFLARYFSAAQGRFTSPDKPFADQDEANPQSWNLYSYARNNPLKYTDPDGQRVQICITGGQCFEVADGEYDGLQPGNPGVVLPTFDFGRDSLSIQSITCGGQNCGTATYINENGGLQPILHPVQDLREQLAPFNPRTWLGAGVRGGVKMAFAQPGKGKPRIHAGKQGKHVRGHNNFQTGRGPTGAPRQILWLRTTDWRFKRSCRFR
jgi:RHS repeat-associated protein